MKILVVEDERKLAHLLERGLREEGFAVDVAEDGEEGLWRARHSGYDLIVLDALLPKKDGFELLHTLRMGGNRTRVLMLTARDSVGDRVRGLNLGADDYLTKPFAFAELLARVRALLRRGNLDSPDLLELADLRLDARARTVHRGGTPLALSAREFAVLEHLLRHAGAVVTRTELAERVWDENYDAASNVIDVTVYHLREKLDRNREPKLIHTVRGAGYVLKADDRPEPA